MQIINDGQSTIAETNTPNNEHRNICRLAPIPGMTSNDQKYDRHHFWFRLASRRNLNQLEWDQCAFHSLTVIAVENVVDRRF